MVWERIRLRVQDEKGVTLIEAMGAVVILSVAILAFAGISQYIRLSFHKSDIRLQAFQLAEQTLNEIRAEAAQTWRPTGYFQRPTTPPDANGLQITVHETALSENPSYRLPSGSHVSIQGILLLLGPSGPEQRLVTVTVSWGGGTSP